MSVLVTVLVAIAAAFIGFIIGFRIGYTDTEPPVAVVTSKVVLPKRVSKAEYTKRVNACLKDAVIKAVNAWVPVTDKSEKRSIINTMYAEWHGRLPELAYSKYNPEFQRLDIVGHKTSSAKSDFRPYSIRFDAVWFVKQPGER